MIGIGGLLFFMYKNKLYLFQNTPGAFGSPYIGINPSEPSIPPGFSTLVDNESNILVDDESNTLIAQD